MATRNRTLLFLQYRNSYNRSAFRQRTHAYEGSESDGLLRPATDAVVDMSVLPPKWVDIVDEVNEDMQRIKEKIAELDALHKKHLLPGFSDKAAEEKEIQAVTNNITKMFQDGQRKIKDIQQRANDDPHKQAAAISRNIQISLASKLQDLSSSFRKSQSDYLSKMQGRSAKPKPLISSYANQSNSSAIEEEEDLDSVFTDAQTQALENTERMIDQREKEINEVVKSIHGLATIFKDLQTMVIDQGTVLDRIDYNIEMVAVHTEEAHKELIKASKYQDNSKARWCIAILVFIILILMLVIILKPKRKTAAPVVDPVSTPIIEPPAPSSTVSL